MEERKPDQDYIFIVTPEFNEKFEKLLKDYLKDNTELKQKTIVVGVGDIDLAMGMMHNLKIGHSFSAINDRIRSLDPPSYDGSVNKYWIDEAGLLPPLDNKVVFPPDYVFTLPPVPEEKDIIDFGKIGEPSKFTGEEYNGLIQGRRIGGVSMAIQLAHILFPPVAGSFAQDKKLDETMKLVPNPVFRTTETIEEVNQPFYKKLSKKGGSKNKKGGRRF